MVDGHDETILDNGERIHEGIDKNTTFRGW